MIATSSQRRVSIKLRLSCVVGLVTGLLASPCSAREYRVGGHGYPTIQAAVDAAMSGPSRNEGGNAVIHVDAGVWKGPTVSGPTPSAGGNIGSSYIEIIGSGAGSTTIEDNSLAGSCGSIIATNGAALLLRNMRVQGAASVSCQSAIFAQNNAVVQIGPGIVFGPARVQHMHAEAHAIIEIFSDYHVRGSAYQHWAVSTGGLILVDPVPLRIIFDQPVSFTHFAWAQSTGVIMIGADKAGSLVQFVHPERVTAAYKYSVQSNGVIDMNGGSQPLPGRAVSTASGGQYVNGV